MHVRRTGYAQVSLIYKIPMVLYNKTPRARETRPNKSLTPFSAAISYDAMLTRRPTSSLLNGIFQNIIRATSASYRDDKNKANAYLSSSQTRPINPPYAAESGDCIYYRHRATGRLSLLISSRARRRVLTPCIYMQTRRETGWKVEIGEKED